MSAFVLKLIALSLMLTDHAGAVFSPLADTYVLRLIGRSSFPIYVFLIAEGCRHTRDIKKYMLRLGAFALISEIPFDMALHGGFFVLAYQNVFFTLLLGVAAVWAYEAALGKNVPKPVAAFAAVPFAALAYALKTDYGMLGVAAVFVCYIGKTRPVQAAMLCAMMFLIYLGGFQYFTAALPAILLIFLYNGRRGMPLRLIFYAAYPLHLLALAGINYFYILR